LPLAAEAQTRSLLVFLGPAAAVTAKLILAKLLVASIRLISKLPGDYIGNRGRGQNPARFLPKLYQHCSRFKMPARQNEPNQAADRPEHEPPMDPKNRKGYAMAILMRGSSQSNPVWPISTAVNSCVW
jgi:hypothetical protein